VGITTETEIRDFDEVSLIQGEVFTQEITRFNILVVIPLLVNFIYHLAHTYDDLYQGFIEYQDVGGIERFDDVDDGTIVHEFHY
jgi:hypothetical protein